MKSVAIIGSNGVLGSDLVRYLSDSFKIHAINRENYDSYIGQYFDVVINANGNSKRFWANENILSDFEASTKSVYKSIFDFTFDQYFYISSSDVYADHTRPATTEESSTDTEHVLSPYGFHKVLSERIVKNYAKKYIILRSSLVLGMNLKKGPIFDILNDKPLFIALNSKIQMITTREIANIISHLLEEGVTNETYNMGGKDTVDFQKLFSIMDRTITVVNDAPTQIYEMNVGKLGELFPLQSSESYLQEYLATTKKKHEN